MRSGLPSLLAGRNAEPLTDEEAVRVTNVIIGLDREVSFRYAPAERTRCRVFNDQTGSEVCEIVFGPDIYPGKSVVDPNSALSMRAAVAHELCHFHRWRDKTELDGDFLVPIDEALTSLEAVQRYHAQLNETELRQLVADSIQRLQMFAQKHSTLDKAVLQ